MPEDELEQEPTVRESYVGEIRGAPRDTEPNIPEAAVSDVAVSEEEVFGDVVQRRRKKKRTSRGEGEIGISAHHRNPQSLLVGARVSFGSTLQLGGRRRNLQPPLFLRAIGPEPWNVAYVEPSRRPTDGRYGDNPNRLQQFHQFQVILKPSPIDIQEQY